MRKVKGRYLAAVALVLALAVAGMALLRTQTPAKDYETRLAAAALMQRCMDGVRAYKTELGLGVSEDDRLGTGMIGEAYTAITTTNGALAAKRTTANADMAALMVKLLDEAGVRRGDTVGAGFSGSFPALDLAVIAACETMGVKLVYIASVGASTYGANQPELTFPDMACRLVREGIIHTAPAAFSLGGAEDCGLDMDAQTVAAIRERLDGWGIPTLYYEDYAENIAARMAIYDESGPIRCFVGVGGNLTTSGRGENTLPYGLVRPYTVRTTDENSGLMARYNAAGLPVIHLLNVKKLAADYGLPYDPEAPAEPGRSAVYCERSYPAALAAAGLAAALALLLLGRRAKRLAALCMLACLLAGCAQQNDAQIQSAPEPSARAETSSTALPQPRGGEADWTLGDFAPLLAGAETAQREEYTLAAGTPWENTVCALRGTAAGKTVYIVGGVHGDEPAGRIAAELAKSMSLRAGTVYILSAANPYGAAHEQRNTESGYDLNRNFPGDPEGTDAAQIAASICADIADKQPALVLDLHEARGERENWDDLSNSVIVYDAAPIGDLIWELLTASEAGALGDVPFNLLGGPPEGSLNRVLSESMGIPTITVETWRGEALALRVARQLAVIAFVLDYCELR